MRSTLDIPHYSKVLNRLAESLDVSPSDFLKMRDRYTSVARYLESQEGDVAFEAYPHGSFALGTVTRPYVNDKDADFDVDIVSEYQAPFTIISPKQLKNLTGDWLKLNGHYEPLLDDEGKRCWTLEYAEKSPGFHIDILPVCLDSDQTKSRLILDSVAPEIAESALQLTHKQDGEYRFFNTNPKGYQKWFSERQKGVHDTLSRSQKEKIFSEQTALVEEFKFMSYDEVPDDLVRTPLQRVIQILKRHRDVRFSGLENSDSRPISVVITTVCALLYDGETDTYEALKNIVKKIDVYSPLLENRHVFTDSLNELGVIRRTQDGKWIFCNPVEPEENFAQQWHENDHAKAKAFFKWAEWVREDFLNGNESETLKKIFGASRFDKAVVGTGYAVSNQIGQQGFPRVNILPASVNKPYST